MDGTATTPTPVTPTVVTWRDRLRQPVTGRALRVWRMVLVTWVAVDLLGGGVAVGLYVAGAR